VNVRDRRRTLVGLVVVIALGLASRRLPLGVELWDKSAGDALYAVMVYLLLSLVRPAAHPVRLGVAAFFVCAAIETFQLTGIPAAMPRLLRFVLGTSFAWHDMACYLIGAVAPALVGSFVRARAA
jgi:hypothetical protein